MGAEAQLRPGFRAPSASAGRCRPPCSGDDRLPGCVRLLHRDCARSLAARPAHPLEAVAAGIRGPCRASRTRGFRLAPDGPPPRRGRSLPAEPASHPLGEAMAVEFLRHEIFVAELARARALLLPLAVAR